MLQWGVDVIHGLGVRTPANAVGVGHFGDLQLQAIFRIETVELGVAGLLDEADGARPETASRVTLAVVEAVVGALFGLGIGETGLQAGEWIELADAEVACVEVATLGSWDDSADALADGPALLVTALRVQAN